VLGDDQLKKGIPPIRWYFPWRYSQTTVKVIYGQMNILNGHNKSASLGKIQFLELIDMNSASIHLYPILHNYLA
jgi:hypothetical protein